MGFFSRNSEGDPASKAEARRTSTKRDVQGFRDEAYWREQRLYDFEALDGKTVYSWTVGDAVQGTQIFGATGSGKTTGSGHALATSFLAAGFGGLVLTAKADELETWVHYFQASGRLLSDLVVLRPQVRHPQSVVIPGAVDAPRRFNFLAYELLRGGQLTQNLVSLFLTALQTGPAEVSGSDPYWNEALRELLTHAVDLVVLAHADQGHAGGGEEAEWLDLLDIVRVVRTAPQHASEVASPKWKSGLCCRFIEKAAALADAGHVKDEGRRADLKETIDYWLHDFPRIVDRTRSIVVSSFTAKVAGLLRSPLREMFCTRLDHDVAPEATHCGKVVILDLPVKLYGEVGRFAQTLYKTIWQRATERRKCEGEWRPVFLWADESQYFITEDDMLFQQTARSKMAATVYLTQNLPNYYAALGKTPIKADSLLGNLQTKVFHANGDPTTNEWAERLFAKAYFASTTVSRSSASSGWQSNEGEDNRHFFQASDFALLATGNVGTRIEAIVFQAGRSWSRGLQRPFPTGVRVHFERG